MEANGSYQARCVKLVEGLSEVDEVCLLLFLEAQYLLN